MKTNIETPPVQRAHPRPAAADETPRILVSSPRLNADSRRRLPWLRRACGIPLSFLLCAGLARAATYTVVSTADSGPGSLRQAILDANANPGADNINFNIPSAGVPRIQPILPLPAITGPVAIDGHNAGNPALRTEINGALIKQGVSVAGVLYFSVLGDFGVETVSGPLAVVQDPASPYGGLSQACSPLPVGSLVGKIALISRGTCSFDSKIQNAQNAGAIGVIVVNREDGGDPFEMCCGYPGAIPAFMAGLADRAALMAMDGQIATLIPVADGLHLAGGSSGSSIRGLVINAFQPPINYSEAAESGIGIRVESSGNTIADNLIGTDATGTTALPNANSAVRLYAAGNTVQNNLLSGNAKDGVSLDVGPNSVLNNKIGSNLAGNATLGNGRVGIWLNWAPGSTISGNLIAANGYQGVLPGIKAEGGSPGTVIQGNSISGNATYGIQLQSSGNLVGGQNPGQGNVIALNQLDGVTVQGGSVNNVVLGNSIYGNGSLGIDLAGDSVTLNDPLDMDGGENHRENFPLLDSNQSILNPGFAIATGTLSSEPNTDYLVQVFGDDAGGAACVGLPDPFITLTGPADVYNVSGAVANIAAAKAAVDAGKAITLFHSTIDSVVLSESLGQDCCGKPFIGNPVFTRTWPIGSADDFSSGVLGSFTLAADANHNGIPGETILVTFGLFSDDGSQVIIKGTGGFIATGGDSLASIRTVYSANDALTADFFTGNSDTYGTIMLTEGQTYDFEAYQFEGGGGSGLTVAYALGDQRGSSALMVPLATADLLTGFIHSSTSCGPQKFLAAEGRYFLGSIPVHTDANGYAAFAQTFVGAGPAAGGFMTATATKVVGGVPTETSEFSEAIDADLINNLITKVNGLPGVKSPIKNALVVKLNAAQKALSKNDKPTACAALKDFIDLCVSQKNKKLIPPSAADDLIARATLIRVVIGCL
jgi:hypothetical protein